MTKSEGYVRERQDDVARRMRNIDIAQAKLDQEKVDLNLEKDMLLRLRDLMKEEAKGE